MVGALCCHHSAILFKCCFINISFDCKFGQYLVIAWVILNISISKHTSNLTCITAIIALVIALKSIVGIIV